MDDALDGLFTVLARNLYAANPAFITQPLEVAELSSRWAPYAQVRRVVDVPTNEDYELLLMRLLSGEGGLLFADEAMQEDLQREAASLNPDLTALRTYGTVRVTMARAALRRVLDLSEEALPAPPPPKPIPRPSAPAAPAVPNPTVAVPTAPRPSAAPACQYCAAALPTGRIVHFCPHCGLNVQAVHCAGCSAELEPGWRFCVGCGRAAPPA
jgi:hypothetical protein